MRILIPIDGSEGSRKAVTYVREILKNLPAVTATVIHVVAPSQTMYPYWGDAGYVPADLLESLQQKAEADASRLLETDAATLRSAGVETQVRLLRGDPATEITRLAREEEFDLVVLGSRGLGRFQGMVLGSVSDRVAHTAHCPVLIVR